MIKGFKRQCVPHLHRELRNEWDVLAMAQHHGLATRLLDWAGNPLTALWFAVRNPAEDNEPGVVLMFQPRDDDYVVDDDDDRKDQSPYAIRKTRFFQPSHLNPRIIAQNGWFSVHARSTKRTHFNSLDKLATYAPRIQELTIPADSFAGIRADLDRVSVNDATLFPDLDGLSRHLNWLHSLSGDEAVSS